MGTAKGGTDNSGAQAAADEAARQQAIQTGTARVNRTFNRQFTPDYYSKISQGYEDYADPQLDQQYKTTQQNLTYALARDGNLNSSTSADQQAGLASAYQTNKMNIANQALDYANQAKSSVESARQNLIGNINSTGSAIGSANNAANTAAALAAPPSYSALGDLFAGTTNALSAQAQAERAAVIAPTYYRAPYSTGLFA